MYVYIGTLIRRHRIALPAPEGDRFYTVKNFNIGQELTLYGRVFSIVVSTHTHTHTHMHHTLVFLSPFYRIVMGLQGTFC